MGTIVYNKNITKYEKFSFLSSHSTKIRTDITNFSLNAPYLQVFIIKGIGYQADIIVNSVENEFYAKRYLFLRVGHSFNLYKIIPNYIGIKILHKDRKLVIYGFNKNSVSNFSKIVYNYRQPSVYTGRGIRIKGFNHKRKLGKKDIKKGKL